MNKLAKLSLLPALLLLSSGCALADIWNVDATFGADKMQGSIDVSWSGSTPTLVSYNLDVTGSNALYDNDFNNADSSVVFFNDGGLFVSDHVDSDFFFLLAWVPPITSGLGTSSIAGDGLLCKDGTCTPSTAGTITTPEPASTEVLGAEGLTLGLGFGLFALLRRRRVLNS